MHISQWRIDAKLYVLGICTFVLTHPSPLLCSWNQQLKVLYIPGLAEVIWAINFFVSSFFLHAFSLLLCMGHMQGLEWCVLGSWNHRIVKVGKGLKDDQVQLLTQHHIHHMSLSAVSTHLLNTSGMVILPLPWEPCSTAWSSFQWGNCS